MSMKKNVLFMTMLSLAACTTNSKPPSVDIDDSVKKIMSINEICKVEDIIADSSRMDVQGDTAWHRINKQLIRVKMGDNYYLRRETKNSIETVMTYYYDDLHKDGR